jgi:hypothetical protein
MVVQKERLVLPMESRGDWRLFGGYQWRSVYKNLQIEAKNNSDKRQVSASYSELR